MPHVGGHDGRTRRIHEPIELLSQAVMERHRAIVSLHGGARSRRLVRPARRRDDATSRSRVILAHNRDEEKEHAAMTLEWLRRNDPKWDDVLRTYLFTEAADHRGRTRRPKARTRHRRGSLVPSATCEGNRPDEPPDARARTRPDDRVGADRRGGERVPCATSSPRAGSSTSTARTAGRRRRSRAGAPRTSSDAPAGIQGRVRARAAAARVPRRVLARTGRARRDRPRRARRRPRPGPRRRAPARARRGRRGVPRPPGGWDPRHRRVRPRTTEVADQRRLPATIPDGCAAPSRCCRPQGSQGRTRSRSVRVATPA